MPWVKYHVDKFAEFVIIVLSMLSLFCFKIAYTKNGNSYFPENSLPFSGHPTKCNQIANSPQNGVSYFENKCFAVFRGCNKIHDFWTFMGAPNNDMQYAHKKSIKFSRRIWRKCYHLLSSRDPLFHAYQISISYMM